MFFDFESTWGPLYNIVHYSMVLDRIQFKKWIPKLFYKKKKKLYRLYRRMTINDSFIYIIYIFLFGCIDCVGVYW